MSIPEILEFDLDPKDPILRAADLHVTNSHWYLGGTGLGAKAAWGGNATQDYGKKDKDIDPQGKRVYFEYYGDGNALKCKLNNNGTIEGSVFWKDHPKVSGVWRQPMGWDNDSTKRRAPPVFELFEHINTKFFKGEFALNGFGEEIGGTIPMWSEKFGDDPNIPGYGTLPGQGNPPGIWTAYCTGKAGGLLMENPNGPRPRKAQGRMQGSAGLHRDASVIKEEDGADYYSIVVVLNPEWKPSWGGAAMYHETLDPNDPECTEIHWKRGYGLGHPTSVHPQKPGRVYLVPSTAVHSGLDLFIPSRPTYQRRLLFRVKRIGSPHYVAPNINCECGWNGVIPASGDCPECRTPIDVTKGWNDATWVEDKTIGERNPESTINLDGKVTSVDSTVTSVGNMR